jgi:hypothetical protein
MLGAANSLSSARWCGLFGGAARQTRNLLYHREHREGTEVAEAARKKLTRPGSQRVQIGKEIVELLLGEGATDGGHHVAAGENRLTNESFVGRQPTGQKLLLEKALQAGPVLSGDGVRVVARCAVLLIQMPTRSLLSVQSQLRVGFSGGVVAAPGEECQENNTGK